MLACACRHVHHQTTQSALPPFLSYVLQAVGMDLDTAPLLAAAAANGATGGEAGTSPNISALGQVRGRNGACMLMGLLKAIKYIAVHRWRAVTTDEYMCLWLSVLQQALHERR